MKSLYCVVIATSLSALLLAGCRVQENKDGQKDNVAISTPFGSMHVDTNDKGGNNADTGLATYPGAVPVKDKDGTHDSADVNMSFGDFHLGVKAASLQTSDSTDKVIAFYRKDMAKYGDVIECRGNKAIGSPTRTADGLTCDEQIKNGVHTGDWDTSSDTIALLAGSKTRQHVVSIKAKDGGTRIGLVMLHLPSDMHSHDSGQEE